MIWVLEADRIERVSAGPCGGSCNADELMTVGITKICEISAILPDPRRVLD
jgi:hypothetical protein